jgi:hypothetical protein
VSAPRPSVPVDEELRREAERFALCYTCEDCVYFLPDAPRGDGCVHGYPNLPHLRRGPDETAEAAPIVFCKEYELR